jgi:hypothetical protein
MAGSRWEAASAMGKWSSMASHGVAGTETREGEERGMV